MLVENLKGETNQANPSVQFSIVLREEEKIKFGREMIRENKYD
jgi:hypothetical protein